MVKLRKHIISKFEQPEYVGNDIWVEFAWSSGHWLDRTSVEALKGECMLNFGVQPDDSDIKASSFIKISWIRRVKNSIRFIDEESMNRYVRLHIMELFETTLFCDKSSTHSSMQGDPVQLSRHRWASSAFTRMGLERMPFLAPVLTAPSFPLARRWVNWVVPNKEQRRWKLDDYRQMFDNITNDNMR
ncbi:hypothetical protein PIB30_063039 [Stylosanthes scabra]|uniref:Uncharacterized protein n=1 Tax=Stylosanthes scabra TaxID=79078 RepID=A0ABU6VNQ7_9FABA|nr:hypothetical protein [Stylosanthes scabra]